MKSSLILFARFGREREGEGEQNFSTAYNTFLCQPESVLYVVVFFKFYQL